MTAAGPIALVVDYPGVQPRGSVADVLSDVTGYELRHPLEDSAPTDTAGRGYAATILRDLGSEASRVTAVLAQCMSAPIAQELAALLAATGRPPVDLVLFDASPCEPELIRATYAKIVAELTGSLPGSAVRVPPAERLDDRSLTYSPAGTLALVGTALRDLVAEIFGRDGSFGDQATELALQAAEVYTLWLTHLVAALNSTTPSWGGTVQHLVSPGHRYAGAWPGARRTDLHEVDAAPGQLLRSPHTPAATERVLRALRVDRPAGGG